MSTEPGKLIGTKLSFQINNASICGTMMAALVLNAMPVNVFFLSVLSNDIIAENPELCFGTRFRIMDDRISKRYVREVLQSEVVLFLQGIPAATFQQGWVEL